jgi:hypothetical protein
LKSTPNSAHDAGDPPQRGPPVRVGLRAPPSPGDVGHGGDHRVGDDRIVGRPRAVPLVPFAELAQARAELRVVRQVGDRPLQHRQQLAALLKHVVGEQPSHLRCGGEQSLVKPNRKRVARGEDGRKAVAQATGELRVDDDRRHLTARTAAACRDVHIAHRKRKIARGVNPGDLNGK